MKTAFVLILAFGLGASAVAAAETPAPCCSVVPTEKPACCTPLSAAKPACCAEEKPAAPLSDRSLYQLEGQWINDAGLPTTLTALRGRPVILALFFASCEYACPVLVHDIKRLLAALTDDLRPQVQRVLVTFDTARDTPSALRAFRERMELDSSWTLLTGTPADVQELAMLVGVKYKQDARGQFAHSNLITLLNGEGEVIHQQAGLMGDISGTAKVLNESKK
jgi:protein SCO1/2